MKKCFRPAWTAAQKHEAVVHRFALQSAARSLLPHELVSKCMRQIVPGREKNAVSVLYVPATSSAHYGGLQICKSVWHCPVCSAKITERRRQELTAGLQRWVGEVGAGVRRTLLVTLTLRHQITDDLPHIFAALKAARRRFVSGRAAAAAAEQFGIVGMVRSLEITYGENGWHPHLHVLMFADQELPMIPFEQSLKERWRDAVKGAGGYASLEYGCDVQFADEDIAEYVAKWGKDPKWTSAHELTKGVTKKGHRKGKTPTQLLDEYLKGNERSGQLWQQYALILKGERQLFWSKGMRDRLGLGQEETDEEIATKQAEIAIILASLSVGAWRVIVANDARGEVLEAAAQHGLIGVQRLLAQLGVSDF